MKCYVIAGETAVGKSKFGIALAKKLKKIGYGARIINGDSQQVITEVPILSDQPQDFGGIPHELYGYKSINEDISSFTWMTDVIQIMTECHTNGEVPIVIGGSGFYLRNLIEGHWQLPKNYPVYEDNEYMHEKVRHNCTVHPNDTYRVARNFTLLNTNTKECNILRPNCDFITIQLKSKNVEQNIMHRLESIFDLAKIEAKQHMHNSLLDKVIGFKEIKAHIKGEISAKEARELMRVRIRQYAKRQRTWFRNKMKFDFIIENSEQLISQHIQELVKIFTTPIDRLI